MTTAALYYSAPYDTFFAIPFILLVWYALDREVVKHFARKRIEQERTSEPDWMWPPRPKDLDSPYG